MKKTLIYIIFSAFYISCTIEAQEPTQLRRSESFLGIHFDFHARADNVEIGRNTTPEMIDSIIDIVHPDYIQTDCKGHPGFSSYPTKVGNQAPSIYGDPLRIWREVTARRGVALFMHYSGVRDARAIELHPEWAATHADGMRDKDETSVFSPYVDNLLIPQLKELASDYGVDGVWVDGECWATIPDYGDRAVSLFKEQTGISNVPKSPSDAHWQEWMNFHREAFRNYLRHYVAAVHSEYPRFQICSNWAYSINMPEPVSVPLDFLSGDYDPDNSVNSVRFNGRYFVHQGLPWDLAAWSWSTKQKQMKTAVQLKREAAVVMALGGGFQVYFGQNRDGSVNLSNLKIMKEVAEFARARQPYCHHSMQIPQVALLLSNKDVYRDVPYLFTQSAGNSHGVLQCLLENQYSVDIVGEETLGADMSRFPLIVIPEWKNLSPVFCADLINYARNGGSLLVIGKETSEQFAGLAGISLSGDAWSTNSLGTGKIGFMPFSLGDEYEKSGDEALRKQLAAVVKNLFPDPLVEVSGSPWVDVSVSLLNGKREIHLVNTSGDHKNAGVIDKIDPVGPLQVTFRSEQKPSKITLQPFGKACDFTYSDKKVHLTVESLDIYDILVIAATE